MAHFQPNRPASPNSREAAVAAEECFTGRSVQQENPEIPQKRQFTTKLLFVMTAGSLKGEQTEE